MDNLMLWSGPSDVCTMISSMHNRGWLIDVDHDCLVHLKRQQFITGDTFRTCLRQTDPRVTFSGNFVEQFLEKMALPLPWPCHFPAPQPFPVTRQLPCHTVTRQLLPA